MRRDDCFRDSEQRTETVPGHSVSRDATAPVVEFGAVRTSRAPMQRIRSVEPRCALGDYPAAFSKLNLSTRLQARALELVDIITIA